MMDKFFSHPGRRATLLRFGIPVVLLLAAVTIAGVALSGGSAEQNSELIGLNISEPKGDYHLWINSFPEGADVYLDDSLYGTTPLQLDAVEPGEYDFTLEMPGYLQFDSSIVVVDESPVRAPLIVLEKIIRVTSTPEGARVWLNDSLLACQTPCELRIDPLDTLLLRIHKTGLDPLYVSAIDLRRNRWSAPHRQEWKISVDSATGSISFDGTFHRDVVIDSRPSGAEVYLGGNDSLLGYTGSEIELPCGLHKYVLRRPPMNDLHLELNITADSKSSYSFEMTRGLRVSAFALGGARHVDINAEVNKVDRGISVRFLDQAITPTVINLPGTEHRVYLKAEDYADTSVIVSATQSSLKVGMRPLEEQKQVEEIPEGMEPERPLQANVVFYVYDDDTDSPIAGAEIIAKIRSEDRTVILGATGESGIFAQRLDAGKYEFRVWRDGYESKKKKHTVKTGEKRIFEMALDPQ